MDPHKNFSFACSDANLLILFSINHPSQGLSIENVLFTGVGGTGSE